jgi:hypothetical protein
MLLSAGIDTELGANTLGYRCRCENKHSCVPLLIQDSKQILSQSARRVGCLPSALSTT